MGINLQKGQKIDLTKGNPQLSKIMVGLGWDMSEARGSHSVDCDASVIMLNNNNKMTEKVYFANKKSKNNAVVHSGDNLTGAGAGDDETIVIDIPQITPETEKMMFVVNIYDCERRKQDFGIVKNAYIRIIDGNGNSEFAKFNLSDNYAGKTALVAGEIYRYNGEWKFNPVGEGTTHKSLSEMTAQYK